MMAIASWGFIGNFHDAVEFGGGEDLIISCDNCQNVIGEGM
jgi:hypothetical protein